MNALFIIIFSDMVVVSAVIHIILYIHTYICIVIHTCIHAYIHTYIHIYIHTFIYTYIHTFIYTYIHTFIHTYNIASYIFVLYIIHGLYNAMTSRFLKANILLL
jgi:hypothetical protein